MVSTPRSLLLGLCVSAGLGACDSRSNGPRDMAFIPPETDLSLSGPGCKLAGPQRQISNLSGQHAYPRITTNGAGYVVGWLSGIPGSPATFRVDVALTDKQGNKLGPNLPLSTTAIAASDPPSLAPINGGTSIAWTRLRGTATDIVLTTIDDSGQKLDTTGKACDPADADCGIFPLTTSGLARGPYLERPFQDQRISGPTENTLGLVFVDGRNYPCTGGICPPSNDVFWKRVQTNGTELIFEKKLTDTRDARFASPRLAFDGYHQGVVWRDITTGTISDLYFTAVDNLGQVTSTSLKIGSASGVNAPSTPDIIWTGTEYALVSATGTDTTAAIVYQRQASTGITTLPPRGVTFGGSACAPAIAFDGTAYGIAYQTDCGKIGSDLNFVRIDATGTRYKVDGTSCGDSVEPNCGQLVLSHNEREGASRPEVVYGGNNEFAVVWMQGPAGPNLQPGFALEVQLQRVHCE